MLRVVIDPGVWIAAVISPHGAPAALLQHWMRGDFEVVVSPKLLEELESVLRRQKFRKYLSEREATEYADLLRRFASVHKDPPEQHGLTPDPGDDYLVSLARVADVHFLVSGDPHLTELSAPIPPVLKPRLFLTKIQEEIVPR